MGTSDDASDDADVAGAAAPAAAALGTPQDVRAILVAAARAGSALTYSEVLGMLGHGFSRPKMRTLCRILDRVDEDCAAAGEPELAVLVVRQSDGLPGQGWWVNGGAREHGHAGSWEGAEAAALVARVQQRAFAYWRNNPDNCGAAMQRT